VSITLLEGDCRVTLPALESSSVQCVITSPPYWGLRDYGTSPLVWGGDADHAHVFTAATHGWNPGGRGERSISTSTLTNGGKLHNMTRATGASMGQHCACGAWLGSLGLEPTPEAYIEHLIDVFREVHRVLRNDGSLWLNLGDSYAGSGKGPSTSISAALHSPNPHSFGLNSGVVPVGAKPKDLLLLPFRMAMALQSDGWWLRSVIPWLKRNSMPESVRDRPTTSLEYVFLLAKSARYYWDRDAVRMGVSGNAHGRGDGVNPKSEKWPSGWASGEDTRSHRELTGRYRPRQNQSFSGAISGPVTSRNRRNSDWFFESWQGLLLEDDDPLALVVNPAPYAGAHYATFPPRLVEPMVKASSRPGDLVLDPFAGAGTVGLVADRFGRDAVLCELNPDYANQAGQRLVDDAPLLVEMER
jgi:site-specific DNA-methyltransferase (adenine-specific)